MREDFLRWTAIVGFAEMGFMALPGAMWHIKYLKDPTIIGANYELVFYNPLRLSVLWARPINFQGIALGPRIPAATIPQLIPLINRCQRKPRFFDLVSDGAKVGIEVYRKDPRAFWACQIFLMGLNTLIIMPFLFVLKDNPLGTLFCITLADYAVVFVGYCVCCWAYERWLSYNGR
ncbi:MAG: hypothetical protein M1812_000547 [Candelaria pacifica]|nr:MAG: hypothetical protein M1812_000547 [Candelaria pacifica]